MTAHRGEGGAGLGRFPRPGSSSGEKGQRCCIYNDRGACGAAFTPVLGPRYPRRAGPRSSCYGRDHGTRHAHREHGRVVLPVRDTKGGGGHLCRLGEQHGQLGGSPMIAEKPNLEMQLRPVLIMTGTAAPRTSGRQTRSLGARLPSLSYSRPASMSICSLANFRRPPDASIHKISG